MWCCMTAADVLFEIICRPICFFVFLCFFVVCWRLLALAVLSEVACLRLSVVWRLLALAVLFGVVWVTAVRR